MRQRSSYPKQFKAQVVQECLQPGATVSVVAISYGISADVIRKWMPVYRNLAKPCHPAGLFYGCSLEAAIGFSEVAYSQSRAAPSC
ncbi:transposase [Pseudomonas cucumis]|uniref:Transposase n=1 Tax=Pseudomonas cucumis TaxID=2954082 RepID=A0ABY9ETJ0_9PSED|nr:transposase [Pseudomonas cucumis]WLG83699.1 transposase [Pseudomonas cucumis]